MNKLYISLIIILSSINLSAQLSISAGSDLNICSGETTNLQAEISPAEAVFTWTVLTGDPNFTPQSNNLTPTVSPNTTTAYLLVASFQNQTLSDTVLVNVNELPIANAGLGGTVCGLIFNLEAIPSIGIGTWSSPNSELSFSNINGAVSMVMSSAPGTFEAVWTENNNNCISSDSVQLTFLAGPVQPTDTIFQFCSLTGQIEFSNLDYPFNVSYSWSNPNTELTLSSSSIKNPSITASSAGDYQLTLSQSSGVAECNTESTINVSYRDYQSAEILINDNLEICAGEFTNIPFTGSGNTSFTPSNVITNIIGSNARLQTDKNIRLVLIKQLDYCISTDTIDVFTSIGVGIQPEVKIDYLCDSIRFTPIDKNVNPLESIWISGTDTTFNQTPTRIAALNSSYQISLLSRTQNGCLLGSSINVSANNQQNIFDFSVPNVFTPNGDGINDLFVVAPNLFLGNCAEMYIYNRYGELIFQSNGGNLSWDGYDFVGQAVNEGTYFYLVKFAETTQKGSLTLFR